MGRVPGRGKGSLSRPRAGAIVGKNQGGSDGRNQTHTAHAVGRTGGRAARRHGRRAGRLAEPAGAGDRALSAGRRRRHHGAHPVRQGGRHPRPAIHHRKSRRRRRHHRRSRGRQGRCGRLHAAARRHGVLGERLALSEPAVRLPQGFRTGVPGLAGAEHPGGHAVAAGDDARRRHRLRQGLARRDRDGVVRQRHAAASLSRDVPARRPASRSTTCPIAAAGWRSPT